MIGSKSAISHKGKEPSGGCGVSFKRSIFGRPSSINEGSKWYLGHLSEWSTYAAEQNLAGKEVVRTVLVKIFDCENERGIAQIRMISHQPLGGKTVKDYSKNDDALRRR